MFFVAFVVTSMTWSGAARAMKVSEGKQGWGFANVSGNASADCASRLA